MKHFEAGRKLGVTPPHRKALLRNLTLALLEHDEIQTTPARAKALRWHADHVVTLAKRGDLHSRRQIIQILGSVQTGVPTKNRVKGAVDRLYNDLVPRFKNRDGGFTQIFRLAFRRAGDNAEQCIMRYLPPPEEKKKKPGTKEKEGSKKKVEVASTGKLKTGGSKVAKPKREEKPVIPPKKGKTE